MGRYFQTETGREGKFMFAVQPSDDPGFMGMKEQEPTDIQYYADKDDEEKIREMLDKQYDLLNVPKEDRLYTCKDLAEYDEYENRVLIDRVFVEIKEDNKDEMEKYKDKIRWSSGKPGYIMFERHGREYGTLPLARIRLGVVILSDIKDTGECWLTAEL